MTEIFLTEALIEKIKEAVKDFRLPVENGMERPPKVITGFLPPKRSGIDDDFPFVIVRADSGKINMEKTDTVVSIIVGCYCEDCEEGHKHCLNVMSRIRNELAMLPNNILARKYVLQFPLEWELPKDQAWKYWQVEMTTTWSCNTPQAEF